MSEESSMSPTEAGMSQLEESFADYADKICDTPYDMLEEVCPHCEGANDCERWLRSCEERRATIMAEIWDAEQTESEDESKDESKDDKPSCAACRGF